MENSEIRSVTVKWWYSNNLEEGKILVTELPVHAMTIPPFGIDVEWEYWVCICFMREWCDNGHVVIFKKEAAEDLVMLNYGNYDRKKIREVLDRLIEKGIFREEKGWLIPLTPIMERISGEKIDSPSWPVEKSYRNIEIIFAY